MREAAGGKPTCLRALRAAPKLQPETYCKFRPGDIDLENELLDQLFTWIHECVTIDANK